MPKPRDDGHGFGVVAADVNDDGLIDLFVANDMNPNFLFLNRGDGTFDDVSEISGAAYNINGMAQSGMGVDAEDVDGDGLPELFVTNFANEYSTLYQNFGKGIFLRQHGRSSAWRPTRCRGSSGAAPWRTSTTTAGPIASSSTGTSTTTAALLGQPVDYEEIPLLFRNDQGQAVPAGDPRRRAYFDTKHVGRGAAFGDIDNDGDIDIVVNHKDGAPALLRNDTKSSNHWIRFVLQGTKSNRDAIGAKVTSRIDWIPASGRSTASARGATACRRPTIRGSWSASARSTEVKKVVIRWPSGIVSTLENLKVDQEYKVVEPKDGKPEPHVPGPKKAEMRSAVPTDRGRKKSRLPPRSCVRLKSGLRHCIATNSKRKEVDRAIGRDLLAGVVLGIVIGRCVGRGLDGAASAQPCRREDIRPARPR